MLTGKQVSALAASFIVCGAAQGYAVPVKALRVDGTMVQGEWVGCPDGSSVDIRSREGITNIVFDDLARVSFEAQAKPPGGGTVFHLADGGRLYGELLGGAPEAVLTRTALGDAVPIAFDRLAAIQLARGVEGNAEAEELFQYAMRERLPAQDILITRGPEDVKSLRGRLESLGLQEGSFVFGDRPRTFQADKIYAIVFAAGATKPPVLPFTVELSDGSVITGTPERADATVLSIATSLGPVVELKISEVRDLRVRSPRVVYLSDLAAAAERLEGLLHRPWPVRKDQSVSAKPLSLGGRVFDKGLGVHSKTELDYHLDRAYVSLVATIGIDDVVRPSGSVLFRVLGDGRVLFDSGAVRGTDSPRDIYVDVASVNMLTLIVDYGDGLDLSDHADWGGARLLKPAPRSAAPSNR